jgi:glycyl-tRNA synthetase beta chain
LPVGELGTLVALADRLDSIAGCVRAGFAPSGGQDPYALRRQSLAVLRLLLETERHLDLQEWIDVALRAQQGGSVSLDEAPAIVADLFWGRLETLLSDLPVEIVRGVLSVSRLDPVENDRAARALAAMRDSDSFGRLLEGAKRCRNILVKEGRLAEEELEGAARADQLRARAQERWKDWQGRAENGTSDGYREDLFRDDAERALHAAVLDRVESLESARARGDHEAVFATLAELGPVIATFFDEVLVNAKEEELRQNRLGFLEQIHYLFARFADLSRVVAR